jgi:hypothetical protein
MTEAGHEKKFIDNIPAIEAAALLGVENLCHMAVLQNLVIYESAQSTGFEVKLEDKLVAPMAYQVVGSNSRKQLNILISHSFLSELFVKKMSIKTVP